MSKTFTACAMALALTVTTSAVARAAPQRQLIPLYVYPFWWIEGNDWYRVCGSMNPIGDGSIVIMNPANGPGPSRNTDYDYVIDRCHEQGHNVIGYVDTGYGSIPLATVKAEIDSYYSWYATLTTDVDARIDGIFLDQMSNDPATASYYHQIYTYIKTKSTSHDDVIGNPGSPSLTDWQLRTSTQAADEIVIFEGPPTGPLGLSSYVRPAWANNYPASDLAMLVYDVPLADVGAICAAISAVGLVEVTNFTITPSATPWNFLQDAAYWTAFRSACP